MSFGGVNLERVIVQPVGSKGKDEENYQNTIINPVPISKIKEYVNENHVENLKEIYEDGDTYVWGATPSKNGRNQNYWKEMEEGHTILLSGGGKIFASAVITYKLQNENLAAELWGYDDQGRTWEYIYFLDEIKKEDIPYERYNKILGYSKKNIIQGLNVLDEEKSIKLLDSLDLGSETYVPKVEKEEIEKGIEKEYKIEGSVDSETIAVRRNEQNYLRKVLFEGSKKERCGICNRLYPVSFLFAAHIKKRAKCEPEEKKDIENIAMPMCKFGCDDLYEKGYITVEDGKVTKLLEETTTPYIEDYIEDIIGNECEYWDEDTKEYFQWHKEYHTKKG